jgi:hypothetical protein
MRQFMAVLAAVVFAAAFVSAASADQAYHTERLALHAVTSGAPGGGMVVNAHADGPNVYAHEIYVLNGAAPGTYQVTLQIFPTSLSCTGGSVVLPTATLTTNAHGNGKADAKFTPEDAASIRGLTLSAFWTISGPATYATDCTVITLD